MILFYFIRCLYHLVYSPTMTILSIFGAFFAVLLEPAARAATNLHHQSSFVDFQTPWLLTSRINPKDHLDSHMGKQMLEGVFSSSLCTNRRLRYRSGISGLSPLDSTSGLHSAPPVGRALPCHHIILPVYLNKTASLVCRRARCVPFE